MDDSCPKNTSVILTPEKDQNSIQADHSISPILQSGFPKTRKSFLASTPAPSFCSKSPEHRKTELVLNILDKLCSPISSNKQNSSITTNRICNQTFHNGNLKIDGKKSVKRLFNNISENEPNCSPAKKFKYTVKNNSIESDGFQDHDISDSTLLAICEATNQMLEGKDSDKQVLDNNCRVNEGCIISEMKIAKNPPLHTDSPLRVQTEKKLTINEPNKDFGLNHSFCLNQLLYEQNNYDNQTSNKLGINELLSNVLVMEKANKFADRTCREKSVNGQIDKPDFVKYFDTLPIPDTLLELESCSDIYSNQEFPVNNSTSITDSQFCEALDAAEIIHDLDKENVSNCTHDQSTTNSVEAKNSNFAKNLSQENVTTIFTGKIHSKSYLTTEKKMQLKVGKDHQDFYTILNQTLTPSSSQTSTNKENNITDSLPIKSEVVLFNKHANNNTLLPDDKIKHIIIDSLNHNTDRLLIKTNRLPSFQTASSEAVKTSRDSLDKARQLFDEQTFVEHAQLPSFQTASGKTVTISEDSLNKARRIFEEEPLADSAKLPSLQTASGKTVTISEDSLNKAKRTFEEEPFVEHAQLPSFQTASDKTVTISEDSLNKAKRTFEEEPLAEPAQLPSFQTASGKTVKISDDSLKKARQIFDEEPLEEHAQLPCFQTASGKTVKISDDFLKKARQLFDEETLEEHAQLQGFQTASGKTVKISDDSLKKARQIFDEEPLEEHAQLPCIQTASGKTVKISDDSLKKARRIFDEEPLEEHAQLPSFQTASGKTVKISDDSLKKARQIFDEEPLEEHAQLPSFQTASGKTVMISDDSLKKARRIFDEEHLEEHAQLPSFQTASGKTVKISDDSLKKARRIFDEEPLEDHAQFPSFQTASGKTVKISDDSLKKARRIFYDEDPEEHARLPSFQTASGKTVKISDDSLKKARRIFDDEHQEEHAQLPSFQSASGKTVKISDDSLKKARGIFDDEHLKEHAQLPNFQTASGKTVLISDDSLKKARRIFDDEPLEEHAQLPSFQTASGKTVKISDDSLKKARRIFDEEPLEEHAQLPSFQTASGKTVKRSYDSLKKARRIFDEEPLEEHTQLPSFQTASGKTVKISDDSLKKARQIFDEEPLEEHAQLPSFQTASGKTVMISDDSLKKARRIFDEEHLEEHAQLPSFQSASGKTVKISDDSLKKARRIFDEEPLEEHAQLPSFQSASGKTVKISDDSLKKARRIFDEEPLEEHTQLPSFQTASGKTVKISDDSLKKARRIFDEEHLEEHAQLPSFQTASGKTVKISDDSLKKARQIFDDKDPEEQAQLPSFQTASGKTVKISDDSLKKARGIFDEEPLEEHTQLPSFQTASGKTVKISDDSLKKARRIFDEEHLEEHAQLPSFQTASGKTVKISDDSLKKARGIFDEEPLEEHTQLPSFQTASGKTVKISDDSLKKARRIFDEEPLEEQAQLPSFQSASGKTVKISDDSLKKARRIFDEEPLEEHAQLPSFQTASGKTVKISDDSLKKARRIFDDKDPEEHAQLPSFQTASGKTVKISDDSLKKARRIFDDEDPEEHAQLPSFQTASGKTVKISDDSLKKARRIFDDKDPEEHAQLPSFQTASGKTVKISDDSLKKARRIFDDEGPEEHAQLPSFQTASGKTVKISDDSLKKVRRIFDDKDPEEHAQLPSFQTASGKTVKISDDSLKKATRIFDDEDPEEHAQLPSFQIASGKTDDPFNKDQQLFDEQPLMQHAKLQSFQTEYGKNFIIPKDSLDEASQFCNDESIRDSVHLPNFHSANLGTRNMRLDFLTAARHNSGNKLLNKDSCSLYSSPLDSIKIKNISEHSPSKGIHQIHKKNLSDVSFQPTTSPETNCQRPDVFLEQASTSLAVDSKCKSIYSGEFPTVQKLSSPVECASTSFKMDVDSVIEQARMPIKCKPNLDQVTSIKCNVSLSSSNISRNNKPIKMPRKLFDESTSNEFKVKYIHSVMNENSSVYSSVISEEDLSLLNKSLVMNVTDDFDSTEHSISHLNSNSETNYLSPGVAHEVSESMAALIADEESNSPLGKLWCLKPVVSSPTTLERNVRLPAIDCDEREISLNNAPLSPVLDSLRSVKTKKLFKKNKNPPLKSHLCHGLQQNSTPLSSTSNFKPPYVTSTPNQATVKGRLKRSLQESLEKESKRSKRDLGNTESTLNQDEYNIGEMRKRSAEKQDKCIQDKMGSQKQTKPCKGSFLIRTQTEERRSLLSLANHSPLRQFSPDQLLALGVKKAVVDVTGSNALYFKFSKDFFSEESVSNVHGVPVGDGALLILDANSEAGVTEVTRAFLASPSIDPALVSADWVHNHFRWLIIKMAATERMFPLQLASRHLTPNNLLLQMKYRYDREIDRFQRPVLRKILEKDESATKPMVLFVVDIFKVETGSSEEKKQSSCVELELSDGWYSVRTCVDCEMNQLIHKKRVKKGTKLMIVGAELINNEDGCHPLETPAAVRLKVSTNSCRRVRWYTRLGLQPRSFPPLSLSSVLSRGGSIHSLSAVVVRRYPLLFMEKLAHGKSVVRGEKAEQTATDTYQHLRQQTAEKLLSQLQTEQERSKRRTRTSVTRRQLQQVSSTQELCRLLDDIDDITLFQDAVSKEQLESVQEYKQEEAVKVQQQLQDKLVKELDEKIPQRVVTRMLKVRLADLSSDHSAILTLWNPSEQVLDLLVEGNHLIVHNLTASGYSRFGNLQLTGGRHTKFVLEKNSVCLRPRIISPLPELQCSDFKPQFSEIDVVGIVLPQDPSSDNPRLFYLADADSNFLAVSLWIDLKESGFSSVVSAGKLVAASNLTWHSRLVSWSLPIAHATEISLFSQHPRLPHLQQALDDLVLKIKSLDFQTYMNDCLERIQSLKAHRDSAGITPLKQTQGSKMQSSLLVNEQPSTSTKMLSVLNKSKDSSKVQTGDILPENDTPSSRKRSWLEQFGEPPALSPLSLSTPSRVKRNFHPPKKKTS